MSDPSEENAGANQSSQTSAASAETPSTSVPDGFNTTSVITEETVYRIFDLIDPSDTENAHADFDDSKSPLVVRALRLLCLSVYSEHDKTSREVRSRVDKVASQLLKDADSLERRLTTVDPLSELFQAVTLDMHMKKQVSCGAGWDEFVPFSSVVQGLHDSLVSTKAIASHLLQWTNEFDKLPPSQRSEWFSGGKTPLERGNRHFAYSYLLGRSSSGTEPLIAREIGKLYEFIFGQPISFSRIKLEFSDPADGTPRRQFHDGLPLRFACAVISQLELFYLMSQPRPNKEQPAALTLGVRKAGEYGAPQPNDLNQYAFPWAHIKHGNKEEYDDDNPWEPIKNSIANVWAKDRARKVDSES